jgi:hypothetical protein
MLGAYLSRYRSLFSLRSPVSALRQSLTVYLLRCQTAKTWDGTADLQQAEHDDKLSHRFT